MDFLYGKSGSLNGGPGTGHLRRGRGLKDQERIYHSLRVSRKLQSQHSYLVRRSKFGFFEHKPSPALTTRENQLSLVSVHDAHGRFAIGLNTSS